MVVFIDTSAFYALMDLSDSGHISAKKTWEKLLGSPIRLITSNYVILETIALLQHRLGLPAVDVFQKDILPVVYTEWVHEKDHHTALNALLTAGRKKLSLVDCVSFEIMRRLNIRKCFALDRHFREQGFEGV
jgi:predicted nucleic acid-binding protein